MALINVSIIISTLVILVMFSFSVKSVLPEFYSITPLAKDTHDMIKEGMLQDSGERLEIIKENVAEMKTKTYSVLYRILIRVALFFVLFMAVFSFLDFLSLKCLFRKSFDARLLLRFCLLQFAWAFLCVILFIFSLWLFKRPLNVLLVFFLFLCSLYFREFLSRAIIQKKGLETTLKAFFKTACTGASLVWLLITILVGICLVVISVGLLEISLSFFILVLLFFVLYFPWNRLYLHMRLESKNKEGSD